MPLDLKNDHLIFDGLESVMAIQAGTDKKQVIKSALQRGVSARDAIGSDGTYTQADVKWHLPRGECLVFEPMAGDFVVDGDGAIWSVNMVDKATLRTRFVAWSKKANLNPNTAVEVRLEKSRMERDETAAVSAKWVLVKIHKAHINETASEITIELERRRAVATHQIFITEETKATAGMRIVDENGKVYLILRVTNRGNMGQATVLDCESARTPVKD